MPLTPFLCGKFISTIANDEVYVTSGGFWQPDKDIAQAMEVLEGLGNDNVFLSKSNIKSDVSWEVEIWDSGLDDESIIIVSDSLTLAICKAVLKATEQG